MKTVSKWWRHQMEAFSALPSLWTGNSLVNFPHKDQWRGTLMFSFICAWMNGWVNNPDADDLSRHRAHYDVIVMTKEDPDGTPYLNHMAAVRWDVISMPHCTIRMLACLVDNTISAQGFRSSLMEIAHCGKRDISLICIKYNSIYYRCCGFICILTLSTKRIVYLCLLQSCAIIFFNVKYLSKNLSIWFIIFILFTLWHFLCCALVT